MPQRLVEFWREAAQKQCKFHPMDLQILQNRRHTLPTGRVPEPWFGIPTQAKVFYLTFNPGHKPNDTSVGERWRSFCIDMMHEKVNYERYLRDAPPEAIKWFRRNHGAFSTIAFPWICNLRLIAYPSPDKSDLGEIGRSPEFLPSAMFMKQFVHEHLLPRAKTGEILLLAMRSADAWGFDPSTEDFWDAGLFISRPLRTTSISPKSRPGSTIAAKLREVGAI